MCNNRHKRMYQGWRKELFLFQRRRSLRALFTLVEKDLTGLALRLWEKVRVRKMMKHENHVGYNLIPFRSGAHQLTARTHERLGNVMCTKSKWCRERGTCSIILWTWACALLFDLMTVAVMYP